jgi:flagellar L-ring protein precursor FlgH
VSSQSLEAPPSNTGSLFQPRYSIGLYTDQQATKVGDIITVIFDEQYQSSKSAETSADKSSNNSMSVPNVLGTVPGWKNLTMDSETANDRQFSGKGEADRSNSLSGQISVTVSDILPNGVLRIRGEKWLTLSEGDEYIRISGMIRPQDITPDNTVASSKVADARISFGGRGNLNNSTKQGWADRIFMSPWWPF